jgi:hypothetical protein
VLAFPIGYATTFEVVTSQRRFAAIREQHAAAGCELEISSSAFPDARRGITPARGQPAVKKRLLDDGGSPTRRRDPAEHSMAGGIGH